MRFNLNAQLCLLNVIVNQKNGYSTKKEVANTAKNQVFQMGANMSFNVLMFAKIIKTCKLWVINYDL